MNAMPLHVGESSQRHQCFPWNHLGLAEIAPQKTQRLSSKSFWLEAMICKNSFSAQDAMAAGEKDKALSVQNMVSQPYDRSNYSYSMVELIQIICYGKNIFPSHWLAHFEWLKLSMHVSGTYMSLWHTAMIRFMDVSDLMPVNRLITSLEPPDFRGECYPYH